MPEYHLLIPSNFNDGSAVAPETLESIETTLCALFNGVTRTDGLSGAWLAPDGVIYRDQLIGYDIETDAEQQLIEFVRDVGRTLRQKAMYLSRRTSSTMLITIDPVPRAESRLGRLEEERLHGGLLDLHGVWPCCRRTSWCRSVRHHRLKGHPGGSSALG